MTTPPDMSSDAERTPAYPPRSPAAGSPPGAVPAAPAPSRSVARPPASTSPAGAAGTRLTTDRAHGALALFILRIAVAAILISHAVRHLQDLDGFKEYVNGLDIPAANTAAVLGPIIEIAIGAALVFGLAVRLAGFSTAVLFVLVIIAVFRNDPIFPDDGAGFTAELEVLLVSCGLVFLLLGGGGWGLDRFFRSRHSRAKEVLGRG